MNNISPLSQQDGRRNKVVSNKRNHKIFTMISTRCLSDEFMASWWEKVKDQPAPRLQVYVHD